MRSGQRWLPWLLGVAVLAAVVLASLHLAEERAFIHLLGQVESAWLLAALILQAGTYLSQGATWRLVLQRAGMQLSRRLAFALGLQKLFVDQSLPSAGLSGTAAVARSLEARGIERPAVMAAVTVDLGCYFLAYVLCLGTAVAILVVEGHASGLVIAASALFLSVGTWLAFVILGAPVRPPGRMAAGLERVSLVGRLLAPLHEADPQLVRDPRLLVRATLLQLSIFVLDAATLWTLVQAMGVQGHVGAVFAGFMIASLLRSVGLLPGGLGTFEAAAVSALTLGGIPVAVALSATLLFRGLSFWLPMLPGLLVARRLMVTTTPAAGTGSGPGWWSISTEQVAACLESSGNGLADEEAARRLAHHGPNVIGEHVTLSRLDVLWNQLRNPLLLLLLFAAAVSIVTGEWVDAAIVIVIVLTSAAIGYSREYRAQSAAERLRARVQVHATALRDGERRQVPLHDIVPGDVVLLSAGSVVPADCRLLEATDFFVNEAVLTGESYPVSKQPGLAEPAAPLARRGNCVYLGTNVRSGSARALVVATGRATEFGQIAHRLELRPPETEFDRGVRRFGELLIKAMMVMTIGVLVVNLLLGRPLVETLLFSIALAVGLSPELLPAILNVNLARGARTMARSGVLVRRLSAIENLGSMNVLCTDKTGTLTEGVVTLDGAWDASGASSSRVLELASTNAALQTGLVNPLDEAILQARRPTLEGTEKLGEVPYDFTRKRLSVVIRDASGPLLVTKGALEPVLGTCTAVAGGSAFDDTVRDALRELAANWTSRGIRVLAVASRRLAAQPAYGREDESDLQFEGFLTFLDPPKPDVGEALRSLAAAGVQVKLITGDSGAVATHLAREVGMPCERVLTGAQLDDLHDDALWRAAEATDLFVEVDPNQKERIIRSLQRMGHVVGFLGDGINDAPAMHAADTSLSVEGAVDVAREAADFVLLERDLAVIMHGIDAGRRTFANTLKYVLTTTSANLGNMISMAVASLFLPFLPLLAGQILLNNLLSDIPAVGIADDAVDEELVATPRRWDMRFLNRFMLQFGLLSSLFDMLTFALLLGLFAASVELFRTGWFVESLLTELLVALVVRTRRPFWRSRPGALLLWTTAAVTLLAFAIPYLPHAGLVGFVPLPPAVVGALVAVALLYVASAEWLKRGFYRREGSALTPHPKAHRPDAPAPTGRGDLTGSR
jgi:Mg2+-importing ATPase